MFQTDRSSAERQVCGAVFGDYIQMVRTYQRRDWSAFLRAEDLGVFDATIAPERWYPMEAYERIGVAVLNVIADNSFSLVHAWGRVMADQLCKLHPDLVDPKDAMRTLERYNSRRRSFFNFDPIVIVSLETRSALIDIDFCMKQVPEVAACFQAMGLFERLIEASGMRTTTSRFNKRSWEGDQHTVLELAWQPFSRRRPRST